MKVHFYAFVLMALFVVAAVNAECPAEDADQGVYLANADDCSTYFVCNHGAGVLQSCPKGLFWNVEETTCDWPDNVDTSGCTIVESEEE